MDRALSAALISALVFPGAGQYFLKHRLRALLFIVPALVSAGYFFRQVMARAEVMVDRVLDGSLAPDPLQIAAELHRDGGVSSTAMNIAATVMVVCWIVSIVDAWLLARRAAAAPPPDPKGMP